MRMSGASGCHVSDDESDNCAEKITNAEDESEVV